MKKHLGVADMLYHWTVVMGAQLRKFTKIIELHTYDG